jgi:hypothetical protein
MDELLDGMANKPAVDAASTEFLWIVSRRTS